MKKNKDTLSVFISDNSIGYYQKNQTDETLSQYGVVPLEVGMIENGYLHDPVGLLKLMASVYKQKSIKPKSIRLVLHELNVLIREVSVKKTSVQKHNLESYLHNPVNTGLNLPFKHPIISHYVKNETDEEYVCILFIADQDLINDYYDVFERLGAKDFQIDLPSLAMYQCYIRKTDYDLSNTLLVGVFEQLISIHIFEEGIPIFSMIEEVEGVGDAFYETVENYIERIANYYRYNLRKDKKTIYNAVIFNLTDRIPQNTFVEKMGLRLKSFITTIVDVGELSPVLSEQSKVIYLAYTSNQLTSLDIKLKANFEIERLNKNALLANYIFVLALAVFSVFTLLYIPLQLHLNEYRNLQAINSELTLQLEALQEEIPSSSDYSSAQIDYNKAFDYLMNQEKSPSGYMNDLSSFIDGGLSLSKYSVNTKEQKITLTLSADSELALNDYLLEIYEAYGMTNETDSARWMVSVPMRKNISALVMEVTVYYA